MFDVQDTVSVSDPRVTEIAEFTGESPEDVIATAQELAAEDGETVSEELDEASETVELIEAFGDAGDLGDLDYDE